MAIDLKKLRHVKAVARTGSISVASQEIFISQPALTRSIAEVEKELGLELFQRTPRGMRLTEAGQSFLSKAQRVLEDFEDLISSAADYRDLNAGRLRIGIAPSAYQHFIVPAVSSFVRCYPKIRVEIESDSAEALVPRLIDGDLDLLVGAARQIGRWSELIVDELTELYCGFMVRKAHPLTNLKRVTEKDFLSYPIVVPATVEPIHTDMAQIYAKHGLAPMKPYYIADSLEYIEAFISNSDAFCPILSLKEHFGRLGRQYFIYQDVVDMPAKLLCSATPSNRVMSPAVNVAKEYLSNQFADDCAG